MDLVGTTLQIGRVEPGDVDAVVDDVHLARRLAEVSSAAVSTVLLRHTDEPCEEAGEHISLCPAEPTGCMFGRQVFGEEDTRYSSEAGAGKSDDGAMV